MNDNPPTIEQMIEALEKNGWQRYRGSETVWQSPKEELFIGPKGAYEIMARRQARAESESQ